MTRSVYDPISNPGPQSCAIIFLGLPERKWIMKKTPIIAMVFLLFVATLALADGKGSVKAPFDPDVGWVILNTAASGKLIVSAHLDSGLPEEEYSVSVRVRYEDGNTDIYSDLATLTTNGQGKGNVQVQVEVHPPAGSQTLRRVAVRVRKAPDPLYVAVAWDIPLK
jgi:hypothetical protein